MVNYCCFRVPADFVKKVQSYVDHSLVTDVQEMTTEESKLSFDHLRILKDLIHGETKTLQRSAYIHLDLLKFGAKFSPQQEICYLYFH